MKYKSERLEIANKVIEIISSYGRHFFKHENTISKFIIENNRVKFVDSYTKKHIYVQYRGRWNGFSEGGTLKSLVQSLYNFIIKNKAVPKHHFYWPDWYCRGDLWGYGTAMEFVRNDIAELNITEEKLHDNQRDKRENQVT